MCIKFDGLVDIFNGEGLFTQDTTRLERDSEVSICVVTEAVGVTVQNESLREYSKALTWEIGVGRGMWTQNRV